MGNVGGGEIIVILLAALLILGPNKLPEAARQIGRAMGELRKVTSGFQRELQDALKDTDEAEARKRGDAIAATRPVAQSPALTDVAPAATPAPDAAPEPAPTGETPNVTAEHAAAQIPPAPFDATVHAPGADR
jgi:sec-independent protein translocase protein TatB